MGWREVEGGGGDWRWGWEVGRAGGCVLRVEKCGRGFLDGAEGSVDSAWEVERYAKVVRVANVMFKNQRDVAVLVPEANTVCGKKR